jgi:peptide-methionine (R)-S-oxide reductase
LLALLGLGGGAALLWRPGAEAEAAPASFPVRHGAAEWKRRLGPKRYHILREAGTERPFSSPLNAEHRRGVFACAGCGQRLFSSATKFDSGTGWPSFFRALPGAVATRTDRAMLMTRTEVLCASCGGHLGHVFGDGPPPTGKRYCMNGLALSFVPS